MKKGSITPFCALSFLLIASLLFVMLESARVTALDRFASLKAENGMDAVCADYSPYLWKEYGILLLDGAYGTEHFSMNYVKETLEEQLESNLKNTLELSDLTLKGVMFATDDGGDAFLNLVAESEKEHLPLGMVEDLLSHYQDREKDVQTEDTGEYEIQEANEVLEAIEETKGLLDPFLQMKSKRTLQLILEEEPVSQKVLTGVTPIQNRSKSKGNIKGASMNAAYRKVLLLQYIEDFFTHYGTGDTTHFLNYEMEYVLCGKQSDAENLSDTFDRLVLLRQGYNMAALLKDTAKLAQVEALANLIGLLVAENPVLVKAIYAGLLAVWAYAESVSDVRALARGQKISLIKSKEEWTTAFLQLPTVSKNCEQGLDYVSYVKQLLFLVSDQKMAYRMMEAMEASMQQEQDYLNCKMHHMIVALQYQMDFCTRPLFYSLAVLGDSYEGKFYFRKIAKRTYIP